MKIEQKEYILAVAVTRTGIFFLSLSACLFMTFLTGCASSRTGVKPGGQGSVDSTLTDRAAGDTISVDEGAIADSTAGESDDPRYGNPAELIEEAKTLCEEGDFASADSCLREAVKAVGAMDNSVETGEWVPSNRYIDEIAALYKEKMPDSFAIPEEITMAQFQSLMSLSIDSLTVMPPDSLAQEIMLCQKNIDYDVPIIWNQRVQRALYFYLRHRETTVDRWFTRAPYYLPAMKQMFAKHGLPQDLAYLPLIESGFNPLAYSYAHASGIWQFIASTGKIFGLRRNFWIDERRDPLRATEAAVAYLGKLYKDFNDWHLALAAYNCGEYGLARALKRNRTNDFWNLKRLPNQTKHYVPFYLAALTIAKNPRCFGITMTQNGTLPVDDTVRITDCIALDDIAAGLGIDPDTLKKKNPHFLRWCTPPDSSAAVLYLPEGKKKEWPGFLAGLPPEKKVRWTRYQIKQGENLPAITSRFSITADALRAINRLTSDKITAGHHLFIPLSDTVFGPEIAFSLPPASEIKALDLPDYEFAGVVTRHRIRPGDNLGKIARKYHVSIASLCRWNRITTRTILRPGKRLVVSRPRPAAPAVAATAPATARPAAATHLVQVGDTPFSVSRKYGITLQELAALNNLNVSHPLIKLGQKLVVGKDSLAIPTIAAAIDTSLHDSTLAAAASAMLSGADSATARSMTADTSAPLADSAATDTSAVDFASAAEPDVRYHVITKGDNLYRLSRAYAVPVAAIMKANGIPDASMVRVGDTLLIPPGTTAHAETPAPAPLPTTVYYTVTKGDTFPGIAAKFDVPVERLYEHNYLSPDSSLVPGNVIKVITLEE